MAARGIIAATASLWCGLLALGCGSGQQPVAPAIAPGTPPTPVAPAPPAPTVCSDDCLLLLEHDFSALEKGGYCDVCGPTDADACARGWPRERLTCDQVDFLRNCIYARLGYGFETAPEWKEVFGKETWYAERPDFKWSDVSSVQVRNAKKLKKMSDRRDCVR